jgi:serine/threonine-protein kinase
VTGGSERDPEDPEVARAREPAAGDEATGPSAAPIGPPTLTTPPLADELTGPPPLEGRRIGPYRLVREIGRGGHGTVYLATRDDAQFRKDVAIKLIRPGMDTADIVRRFRRERQILATLDHPHIAKLHDGGTTEDGLPYFVMEHVAGQPIDRFCDERSLPVSSRLELFRKVCAAAHFAHQNLVVHRDLKPANILVTADGEPKLLDFGIAKLLKPELYAATLDVTQVDSRAMTPDYASPEQVTGAPITTASDVYSLGVVLYELLTGHRPYRLKSLDLAAMLRVIGEEEPMRPSAKIWSVDEAGPPEGETGGATPWKVSAPREGSPEKLRRRLAGDLDTIVLMAMRKEPRRRYASVAELSEDLRRHLEGLPVLARPDTLAYRASKFVRRHRLGVAGAAAFLLLLAAFGIVMAVQSARLAEQRNLAEGEAAKAKAINAFLQETLGSANPVEGIGREVTVLQALEAAAGKIDASFADQPAVAAAVRHTIGSTYLRLGRYDAAEPLLRAAYETRKKVAGPESPEVAESLTQLGGVFLYRGDYRQAERAFRESLVLLRKRLGRHPEVAAGLNNLAVALTHLGDYEAAEPLFREALALRRQLLGEESLKVAETLNNLAFLLHDKGDLEAARSIYSQVVALDRRLLGDAHPDLAVDLDNYASLLDDMGEREAAEPLFREALEIRRRALGSDHPDVAKSLNNLAALLERKGEHAPAEAFYREAIALRRKLFAGPNPDLATNLANLARLLTTTGAYGEALGLFREAQAMYRQTLGENHWLFANSRSGLGHCLARMGRFPQAEEELLAALGSLAASLGEAHERTRTARKHLLALYEAWGKADKAGEQRSILESTRPQERRPGGS